MLPRNRNKLLPPTPGVEEEMSNEADNEYRAAKEAETDALARLGSAESDLIDARRRMYAVRDQTTLHKAMRGHWIGRDDWNVGTWVP